MGKALEIKGLEKKFKKEIVIDNLNLTIEENKIYALLGRNGAGKTTLLKLITSRLTKDRGSIKIFGEENFENENALSKICFVGEGYDLLSANKIKEIFKIAKSFYKNWDEEYKDKLVKLFELNEDKKYKTLSKGQQSMISIIIGLASRAEITIFDEVYTGLDAVAREIFYKELLEDFMENKRTIIYSTHLIQEGESLFEGAIIINKGKLLLNEDVSTIREKSYKVMGAKERVEKITEGMNILSKSYFGGQCEMDIYQELSKDDILKFKSSNINISHMNLGETFIKMVNN